MEPIQDEQILAFVCGLLPLAERTALAARMVDDAELSERVESVRRTLAPLAAWSAPEPAPTAVDAIMQRVSESSPLKYVARTAPLSPVESGSAGRGGRFTLPQFFAIAASIALLLSVFFPTMQRRHDQHMQTACLNRMRELGAGIIQYASTYDQSLPRIGTPQAVNWLQMPQRRQIMPAIRLRFVSPSAIFCPTGPAHSVNEDVARTHLEAFLEQTDLRFYTVQHPAGGPQQLMSTQRRMPIAGDENPMFIRGQVRLTTDAAANSPAHRGRGQNVLFSDGAAEFLSTPQLSALQGLPGADNIWRAEHVKTYSGTEAPASATDSFLIP